MSTYLVDSTDMTAIANAIRQKDGTQTTMTVSDMPTRIQNIPTGGGTDYMAERCKGTLSSYTIPNTVTQIYAYSFYEQPITSLTIPNSVTVIGEYALYNSKIGSLFIPNSVRQIGSLAIANIYGTSASAPHLSSIEFDNNMNIQLGNSCFSRNNYMTSLVNFNINGIVNHNIPMQCFYQTALVGDISLGSSAKVGNSGFNNNKSTGILYIHLTQTDATALTSSYTFGSSSFNLDHCRLVVPTGMLSDYQSAFPDYSSIMMEETT